MYVQKIEKKEHYKIMAVVKHYYHLKKKCLDYLYHVVVHMHYWLKRFKNYSISYLIFAL